MKVLAVLRAEQYSPNAVEKDRAIMLAVVERLRAGGHIVDIVSESEPWTLPADCDWVLSMGRLPETLRKLQDAGVRAVNSPAGVAHCRRKVLQQLMRENKVPMPPEEGDCGYWLKRGDAAGSMTDDDVVFAADSAALQACEAAFRRRGIDDYVVSAHVKGDEVKFYGVLHTGFFRSYHSSGLQSAEVPGLLEAEMSGLQSETEVSGQSETEVPGLQEAAERLAAIVGVEVYGGDCIVKDDGTFCIIDFNDWPSFSRCREEAAEAIARCAKESSLRPKE